MSNTTTSRRDFLKTGALAAVPVAAAGFPAAAIAADDSQAALARLQDERALEALTREALRQFNQGGSAQFAAGVTRVALTDEAHELEVTGDTATARFACTVDTAHALEGQGTLLDMARLQGNAGRTETTGQTLLARYTRQQGQWAIAALDLT
jgi:hypothetical protein